MKALALLLLVVPGLAFGQAQIPPNPTPSGLSGTNTGDVTLTAVGSSPSANAASISGQALTIQPADATHPGVIAASGSQTLAPTITLTNAPISANGFHGFSSNAGGVEFDATELYLRSPNNGGEVHLTSKAGVEYGKFNAVGLSFGTSARSVTFAYADQSGSPGSATSNRGSGRAAIALGASSITITNSLADTGSVVVLTPEDRDATCVSPVVSYASGSFTISCAANATAIWKFRWVLVNPPVP